MSDMPPADRNVAGPPPVPPPIGAAPPAQGPAAVAGAPIVVSQPAKQTSWLKRILVTFCVLVFFMSLLMNFYLLVIVAAQMHRALDQATVKKGEEDQTVAVYEVSGIIDGEVSGRFARFWDEVKGKPNVKAVVLRVDSPGGTVTDSDRISKMVDQLRSEHGKIVVISMGGIAASGGYYISAPADQIIAEPTTITGSIGVLAQGLLVKDALAKIGIEPVIMKSTRARGWKDAGTPFRKADKRERAYLQDFLDKMQQRFEDVVTKGRGARLRPRENTYDITVQGDDGQKVETHTETEPLNGKAYLAGDALKLGLIDDIGYEPKAIDRAAELARLGKPNVIRYRPRRGLMTQLFEGRKAKSFELSLDLLDKLQTPRLMMLWTGD